MRIVLFDTILERHLAQSLKRSLEALGHDVVFTDLILHGHSMISKPGDIKLIQKHIDEVLSYPTDLFIAFRPMNLLANMVKEISKKTKTAIWLSDDPVLYKTCYKDVIDSYDIVLHCGNEKVMDFYFSKGHKAGFNFPFWTDEIAFPPVYLKNTIEYDGIFLGNMHGQVRHRRYLEISKVPANIKVFGLVDSDPFGMHGGFIRDGYQDTELVSEVLSKAKFAISIPQFFSDYKGLAEYEFDELTSLGYFQFPSRIIQYASSGLPIVAVGKSDMLEVFPEIYIADNVEGLYEEIDKLTNDRVYAENKSKKILKRFNSNCNKLFYKNIRILGSFLSGLFSYSCFCPLLPTLNSAFPCRNSPRVMSTKQ